MKQGLKVVLISLLLAVPLSSMSGAATASGGGSTSTCPSGTTLDTALGLCKGSASCPPGFNNTGPKCDGVGLGSCASGSTYTDLFGGTCYACPSGTNLNTSAGNYCEAPSICPSGFTNTGPKCDGVGLGSCPAGYTYTDLFGGTCYACPSGTNFNPSAGNYCTAPAVCPAGTTLSGSKCSDGSKPTCPSGTTFDTYYHDCYVPIIPAGYQCPSGTYLIAGDYCQSIPTCPSIPGIAFDTYYFDCSEPITPSPYECPGGTYLIAGDYCQSIPACPSGTSLSTSSFACIGPPSYACSAYSGEALEMCLVIGQPDTTSIVPGKAPTPTDLGNPTAVAFDPKGSLWVSDATDNRVLEYEPPFSMGEAAIVVIGQKSLSGSGDSSPDGALFGPTGLAFDSSGNLWVVDSGNNRVLRFSSPFKNGEAASLVLGQPTFGGYIGQTSADGLNEPSYLALDPSGNLWVADQGNNRVVEFTSPFSTGQKASLAIGQDSFTGSDPASTASGLFGPQGIGFDTKGNLWVADSANHRILEYTPPFSKGQAASLVLGQSSLAGKGSPATALTGVSAIAFDSSGSLWFSDGIDGVGEFLAPLSTGEAITQVIGPKSSTSSSTSAGSALREPQGIAFDSGGNLWVADSHHGRVLEYSSGVASTASVSSSNPSSTTTGTASTPSGAVPDLPYQVGVAAVFTIIIAGSYLLARHRFEARSSPGQKTSSLSFDAAS